MTVHTNLKNIFIGHNCVIDANALIGFKESGSGGIHIGNNVTIRHDVVIRTCGGCIHINDGSIINYGTIMHGMGGISIGKNVLISPKVQIYAQNHGISRTRLIKDQDQTGFGITIADDVWIGAGAIITDNVNINIGAVVGAGSVVVKNVLPYQIVAGNPAKEIGERK